MLVKQCITEQVRNNKNNTGTLTRHWHWHGGVIINRVRTSVKRVPMHDKG